MPNLQVSRGQQANAASSNPFTARGMSDGSVVISEYEGRFEAACTDGVLYAGGKVLTSVSNATFTTATLDATSTPIVGLWNPITSGVNAVILQASLQVIQTALQHTGLGGCIWAVSTGNTATPSTGAFGWNRKTLALSTGSPGSVVKYMGGVALTGLTNNLVAAFGTPMGGGVVSNVSTLDTAVGEATAGVPTLENFDGSLIVPPGGVIALLCATTPVGFSAIGGMLWKEASTTAG